MSNGLVFPCLCSITNFGVADWCSCVLGLSGNLTISVEKNDCSGKEEAAPQLLSKLHHPPGAALLGCTESIR